MARSATRRFNQGPAGGPGAGQQSGTARLAPKLALGATDRMFPRSLFTPRFARFSACDPCPPHALPPTRPHRIRSESSRTGATACPTARARTSSPLTSSRTSAPTTGRTPYRESCSATAWCPIRLACARSSAVPVARARTTDRPTPGPAGCWCVPSSPAPPSSMGTARPRKTSSSRSTSPPTCRPTGCFRHPGRGCRGSRAAGWSRGATPSPSWSGAWKP